MRSKILFISYLIFLLPFVSKGQENNIQDTSYTIQPISIPQTDSVLIKNKIKSDHFYDSLINLASKNKLTKTALDYIIVNPNKKGRYIGSEDLRNEEYYRLYEGKQIRSIEILKLDVFGPSLSDTSRESTRWFHRVGNNTHVKTRDFIVKNNLFFQEGDSIDPAQLVDNERLLRNLDYIKDASIQIAEVPEEPGMVDVLVIIKDVYSLGIYVDLYNAYEGVTEVYENNIAGIGHQFVASLYYSTIEEIPLGYKFSYKIGNIGNSFIKSDINYTKAFFTERFRVDLSRKFVSYNTKWAGKFSFYQTSTIKDIRKTDTILKNVLLNYSTQDIWVGRAFMLNTKNPDYKNRSKIVLGFRYSNNTFYKGPEVNEIYNFQYHDNQIALFSFSYARQKHYKSSLIYGFGKTEDIPIGLLMQISAGPEKDEFYKRIYGGLKLSKGDYFPKVGYLGVSSEFGGHYYQNELDQGVFNIKLQAVSNLHYINKLKFRNFIGIDYTRGINRFPDEQLFLTADNIWGFNSIYTYGTQRLSLHSEIVSFSNLYIYNFRFLFFGFGDLGLIGPENQSIFNQKLYSGIGLGFRIRNENLVFKTLQVKFAFYPTVPDDVNQVSFILSGENYSKPIDFEPSSPEIIEYR